MRNLRRSISAQPASCAEHMTDTAIEAMLRHDRAIVAGALFLLAGLAWAYMLWLAAHMDMGGMDMSGFRMIPSGMALVVPTTAPWNATEFAFVFVMWAVMMVGMMTPSATLMILIYARVGRQAAQQGKRFAPSSWFRRLSSRLDRLCNCCDVRAMGAGTGELAYPENGSRERDPQRHRVDFSRSLSVDSSRTPACGNAGRRCNSFSSTVGFALTRSARWYWVPATALIALVVAGS